MNVKDYVPLAVRTESKIDKIVFDNDQLHELISMSIAITEVMDLVKKNVFYGKPIDADKWKALLTTISLTATSEALGPINEKPTAYKNINTRLFHSTIGIFTEAGEMFSAMHNPHADEAKTVDPVNFKEELGDTEWYQAIAYDALQVNPEDNLQNNIDKLAARYPNKFESIRAITRDLEAERSILEGKN